MKVYFAHSVQLHQVLKDYFQDYFTRSKLSVLTRRIPVDPTTTNFKEAEEIYESNLKMVKSADIIITEISYVSIDIGHDILYAIQEKKPAIALFNMKEDLQNPRHIRNVPIGLKGNKNKFLLLREYTSKTLPQVINTALKDAAKLFDRKFNFILPAEIDEYLEWNAKNRNITKSEIARAAIEEMMENDAEFQHCKNNTF